MEDLRQIVSVIRGQEDKIKAALNAFLSFMKFLGFMDDEESKRNEEMFNFMKRVDKHLEELEAKINEIGIVVVLQGYNDDEKIFRSAILDCKRYANDKHYKPERNRDDLIKNAVIHYLQGICGTKLLHAGDILSSVTEKYQRCAFKIDGFIKKSFTLINGATAAYIFYAYRCGRLDEQVVSVLEEIKKEYDEAYKKVLECERKCLLDFTNLREKIKAIVDHQDFRNKGGLINFQVHTKVCDYLDEQYHNIESAEKTKVIPTVEWLVLTSSLVRATKSYWLFSGYDDNSHCVRGIEHNYFLFADQRLVVFYPIVDGKVASFNHTEIRNFINNYRVGLFNSKAISWHNYAKSISKLLAKKNIQRSIVIHNRWIETYIADENSNEESYSFECHNNICVQKPSNDILSGEFEQYYIAVF